MRRVIPEVVSALEERKSQSFFAGRADNVRAILFCRRAFCSCFIYMESPTYILNEDTQLVMRAIGVSHTACKDEFRRNLQSHSWSVFSFFIIVPRSL